MTRDLRKYSRQTTARLFGGFFIILLVVGLGLIYWIWGRDAALMGLVCMSGTLVPVVLVWLLLALMGWIAKKAQE